MAKVPCSQCGALILPTTAESTGGICMACKQGIRKDLEASREYHERLKDYDPVRELWKSLVNRSAENAFLNSWTGPEKLYFAVRLLEMEAYRGGLESYFFNSSADYYDHAIAGLTQIGAVQSLRLFQEAAHLLFGESDPPRSREHRWKLMRSNAQQPSAIDGQYLHGMQLNRLDREFWTDPDRLEDRLIAYAKQHGLLEPFERHSG